MIEVFGNTTKKEVKLDNPLSFDQCSISSVSLYTDFVLHNVPTDQVVLINAGSTPQEITIPRDPIDPWIRIGQLGERTGQSETVLHVVLEQSSGCY